MPARIHAPQASVRNFMEIVPSAVFFILIPSRTHSAIRAKPEPGSALLPLCGIRVIDISPLFFIRVPAVCKNPLALFVLLPGAGHAAIRRFCPRAGNGTSDGAPGAISSRASRTSRVSQTGGINFADHLKL